MYVLLVFICGTFIVTSYIGNREIDFSWRADYLAFTFIPMTLFVIEILLWQVNLPFSWMFAGQVILVGLSLLTAAIYHMFPEVSVTAAVVHLTLVVIFTLFNITLYK